MRIIISALACWLLAAGTAMAEDRVLQYDKGVADTFEHLSTDAHYIEFHTPPAWDNTFLSGISLYGYRKGDPGNITGTLIVWAPEVPVAGGPATADGVKIYARSLFELRQIPDKAGWFSIPLEPAELPKRFMVSLFTYSSSHEIEIGLTKASKERSHSAAGLPARMLDPKAITFRRDGRNWMLRASVSSVLNSGAALGAAELSGAGFGYHDDGTAEGYATTQKKGPLVIFDSGGARKINRVYVYAKLSGNWFNSQRAAGVWILNEKLGILYHASLPYNRFTSVAGWGYVDIPDIAVNGKYYVHLEPVSRPEQQMMLGYDTSSANRYSFFGDAGSMLDWVIEAPQDKTTWMFRTRYK